MQEYIWGSRKEKNIWEIIYEKPSVNLCEVFALAILSCIVIWCLENIKMKDWWWKIDK